MTRTISRAACPAAESCRIDWSTVDPSTIDWAAIDWSGGWSARDWATAWASPGPSTAWETVDWATTWSTDTTWPAAEPDARPSSARPGAAGTAGRGFPVTVYAINEPVPGPRWKALFDQTWPAYRAWYLSGAGDRPSLEEATTMLGRHMPELLPTYRRLVGLAGNDPVAARMLTMWNMPAFLPACSQAALSGPSPALCRNYDYSPDLWERTIYTSAFTGRKVIGTGDCLWGLLDGMNDAGLAVSLTFAGRPGSGPGFAVPLVVRYLLEVAGTAPEARELLRNLPVAMSYNLTVVDASGEAFTAFVAPGQQAEFSDAPAATNHHGAVPEYPERAASLRSVPRLDRLTELLGQGPSPEELAAAFLEEPLYNDEYSRAFGTLYSVSYRPVEQRVEYRWPGVTWERGFADGDAVREVLLAGR